MTIEVRPIEPSELPAVITNDGRAFGITYTDADREVIGTLLELDRTLVAVDGPDAVGCTSAFTFELTVPGGAAVATAGVTWVGVLATHRRQGILRRLMTRQLDDLLERGDPLAALTASESGIYGRFGYGLATRRARVQLATKRIRFRDGVGADGQVRYVDAVTARKTLPGLYDRLRAIQPGTLSRNDRWWDHLLGDAEHLRDGASGLFFLVHPDGYATYRQRAGWTDGLPTNAVVVNEVVAVTAEAHAALWRVLVELDLVESLTFTRFSPDDPLPWLVADPRRVQLTGVWDDGWVRLLRVPAALEARRYAVEDRFVLEVVDGSCPSVGGRFELDGGPDGATCRRTTAAPDLTMDVAELASLFMGGVRATTLQRAWRIEEHTPGAAGRADRFFLSDPPPHNQTPF